MKIIKFIKKNYKRLVIQIVSIISAFVIFSVPVFAVVGTVDTVKAAELWCTNFSVRTGNFSGNNWGTVVETWSMTHSYYYSPYGDITNTEPTGRTVVYPYEENSIELDEKYLVMTWLLSDDSVQIESGVGYKISVPLVFVMETNKTIVTDYFKFAFWDRNNNTTPYFIAESNQKITWQPTAHDGFYELLFTITLQNNSNVDIIPNYIRMAIKIDNTLKFWQGNEFGFYRDITVEDLGKLYPLPNTDSLNNQTHLEQEIIASTEQGRENLNTILNTKPNVNFTSGIMAVTKLFNKVLDIAAFDGILDFSLKVGLCAFLLGLAPVMLRGIGRNKNNNNSKGG